MYIFIHIYIYLHLQSGLSGLAYKGILLGIIVARVLAWFLPVALL